MKRFFLLSALLSILCCGCAHQRQQDTLTVVVSLDAFRWDYTDIHRAPWLDSIGRAGIRAVMKPSYPSSTFPNHYTLATGLRPDHHGIVNSSFWDSERGVMYGMGDSTTRNRPYYYGGEPIWATAGKQGVRTASVYWVGSDIPIGGALPTYWLYWYDTPRLDFAARVQETLRLAALPEDERPALIMTYFDEPDMTGHEFGPASIETGLMVAYLDSLMGVLYRGLRALPHGDRVNLIVTADHGMTDISDERCVRIDEAVDTSLCEHIVSTNPTTIFSKPGCRDRILEQLSKVEHISAWKSEEMPGHLHYGSSPRLGDIVVAPDLGWQFTFKPRGILGAHGFDPEEPDMQVIFRAAGPDFKPGYVKADKFDNVDLYPLLARLLRIRPAATDGSLEEVSDLLANPHSAK